MNLNIWRYIWIWWHLFTFSFRSVACITTFKAHWVGAFLINDNCWQINCMTLHQRFSMTIIILLTKSWASVRSCVIDFLHLTYWWLFRTIDWCCLLLTSCIIWGAGICILLRCHFKIPIWLVYLNLHEWILMLASILGIRTCLCTISSIFKGTFLTALLKGL